MKAERTNIIFAMLLAAVVLTAPAFSIAQQPTLEERVAALKATLAASQAVLRQYEWIETTTVNLKGEEKSRKQERCYYGADGKVTKVLLSQTAPEPEKRGLRGRIAEHKKEELTEYMHEEVVLVHQYVPLNQARIQAVKDSGKMSVQLMEPGKQARLTFRDYLKSGDRLAVDVDLTNNHPVAAYINSYLDSQKEGIKLSVKFGTLNDGTTYASGAVLDAQGKKLNVTIENSGYRKIAQ